MRFYNEEKEEKSREDILAQYPEEDRVEQILWAYTHSSLTWREFLQQWDRFVDPYLKRDLQ